MERYSVLEVGKNIKIHRLSNSWSIKDLSNKTGIAVTSILDFEAGDRSPNLHTFCKLLEIFNGNPHDFMKKENKRNENLSCHI